jgi:heat shock protein HtpX
MEKHISFFDAINENKRNSIILTVFMFSLFMGVIWAFSYIFNLGIFGLIVGFFALLFYVFVVWKAGDKIILGIAGAQEATREQYPFLYNIVEGLSMAAGIPQPKIYVIDDEAPNAFATGRDPEHASIAVTTGLLKIMKREELEGVVAHEISHIANYDIRFMMIAVVFVGAITLLADITWRLIRIGLLSGHVVEEERIRSGPLRVRVVEEKRGGGAGILLLIAIVLLLLSPVFAEMIRFAISRQREYLADANAAKLTRYPEGLASALLKISNVNIPVKNATDATAPLYISNPFPNRFTHLFSTHPPIADRVARLRAM